jgi:outer membrane protein assembly factor BamB
MAKCGRVILALALVLSAGAAWAADGGQDWPCWRGPKGDGLTDVTGIRKDWAQGLKKVWEVKDLCSGKNAASWSAPAIVGDRLVVPGRVGTKDTVVCLNANTGAAVWKKEYDAPGKVQYGNGSRATPAIDGGMVYTFGCMGHIACWKLADGEKVWMKNVKALGGQKPYWGHSSSPLVYKDKVIVQGGGKVLVVAFDKATGKVAWKSMTGKAAYAAPTLVTIDETPMLLVFTAAGLAALNPDDGKKLWTHTFRTAVDMNCSTPVRVGKDGLLLSSSNYGKKGGGTALLKLSATGAKQIWRQRVTAAAHNDPVVADGHIYAYSGYSMNPRELHCVELATGKVKWRTAKAGGPGNVALVDGLLMCLGNRGKLSLVRPNAGKFDLVTSFQAISGRPVWTVPVMVRGKLYVRFANHLICYQLKAEDK